MTGHTCPRCGAEVAPGPGRGRPRVWCSTACRRAAHIERQAAERDGKPVPQVVVVPRPPTPREDANAVAALLHQLAEDLEQGRHLPRTVRQAMDAVTTAVQSESVEPWAYYAPPPPAIQRERAKARERMRRLRARRAAEAPPEPPKPTPPPSPQPPPPAPPTRSHWDNLDAVETFIDKTTSRIRARDVDDELEVAYRRVLIASQRMVEAADELKKGSTPPPSPPPTMNRAQRRQAQRREQ